MTQHLAAVDFGGAVTDGFRTIATFIPKLIGAWANADSDTFSHTPAYANGKIYATGGDGKIYAFSTTGATIEFGLV